jgi:hypothetical protein
MTHDDDMFRLYRDELRADRESLRRAVTTARAVQQHVDDVLDDDPAMTLRSIASCNTRAATLTTS